MYILLTFIGVVTITMVLSELVRLWQNRLPIRRLALVQRRELSEDEKDLARPFVGRVVLPLVEVLRQWIGRFAPMSMQASVRQELIQAGWQQRLRPVDFILLRGFLMLFLPLSAWIMLGLAQAPLRIRLMEAMVFFFFGWRGPMLLLRRAIAERSRAIEKDLPYTLDLLVVSAEAGLGFDGAVQRVVQRTKGPLSRELDRVLQEMRLGKTRQEAWLALKDRANVSELNSFVTAVIQASQLGLSLSNVLRVQADLVRQRRRERAEIQARKMTIKILMPLIFFIFPALFIVILGPVVVTIVETFKTAGL